MGRPCSNPSASFDAKYIPEPNSGCWLWQGAVDRKGYGSLRVAGKMTRATHFSLLLSCVAKGESHTQVCHTCDVPCCVNPTHLFWGTGSDNMKDCAKKGRHPQSQKNRCPQGHLYAGRNLKLAWDSTGGRHRQCRICANDAVRRWRTRS